MRCDAPFTSGRAKAKLVRCLDDGDVIYSNHFRDELLADDLTTGEVVRVCKSGAIVLPPEKDIRSGGWKYRIEGATADHRRVAVVFTFRGDRAMLITVFERAQ